MIGSRRKQEISYLLVSLLEVAKEYKQEEVDAFIAEYVNPTILEQPGFSVVHIRRCMVDNGYLRREADGKKYWVSEDFVGPDGRERRKREELVRPSDSTDDKRVCPYCRKKFNKSVILKHYEKKHEEPGYWEERINEFFK